MSTCGNGHKVPQGQRFCGECGTAVDSTNVPRDDPPEGVIRIEQATSRTARWVHDEPEQGVFLAIGILVVIAILLAALLVAVMSGTGDDRNALSGGSDDRAATSTTAHLGGFVVVPHYPPTDENVAVLFQVRTAHHEMRGVQGDTILEAAYAVCEGEGDEVPPDLKEALTDEGATPEAIDYLTRYALAMLCEVNP